MTEKIALVTGGARGIGRAISERLARSGFTIVVNYKSSREAALQVCSEIESAGGAAWACEADVCERDAVNRLFACISQRHGRLDVLVNNAGKTHEAPFLLTPPDRFQDLYETNFLGVVRCSQAALKMMARQKAGTIVNVSSSSATRAPIGLSAYAASKAALNALTASMAREVARYGIRVNGVAPSWTETEMIANADEAQRSERTRRIPLGRIASADEVAAVVAALASPEFSYVTGQTVPVDGGGIL